MELCRLCGAEKKSKDLVISLSEEIQIITFREFVEYYCRIQLDQNSHLPQKVCQSCKNSVVKFAEFSYIVDEQQKNFDIKPKLSEILDEPQEKKPKIDEPANNNNMEPDPLAVNSEDSDKKTELLTEKLETVIETSKHSRIHLRRKSVMVRQSTEASHLNEKSIARHIEDVEKIFGREPQEKSEFYEKITIAKSKLSANGEVPKEWLEQFKDFKTWNDISYTCTQHCTEEFNNLNSLLWHNEKSVQIKNRSIKCKLCNKKFAGSQYSLCTYLNHMSRLHYEYIKFCCVVCSKVFYNMPHLAKHYQNVHPERDLSMFPCLECGLYCQSMTHLISHKKSHEKSDEEISDVE